MPGMTPTEVAIIPTYTPQVATPQPTSTPKPPNTPEHTPTIEASPTPQSTFTVVPTPEVRVPDGYEMATIQTSETELNFFSG